MIVVRHSGRRWDALPVVVGTSCRRTILNVLALTVLGVISLTSVDLFPDNHTVLLAGLAGVVLALVLAAGAPAVRAARDGRRVEQLKGLADQLRMGLAVFRRPRLAAIASAGQFGAWALQIAAVYLLLAALHLSEQTGFMGAVAVLFAVNVTLLLPVTPGDVGVYQAVAAAVLHTGWQVPFSTGVAFGVVLQAVELVAALVMGVAALLLEGLSWRQLLQRPPGGAPKHSPPPSGINADVYPRRGARESHPRVLRSGPGPPVPSGRRAAEGSGCRDVGGPGVRRSGLDTDPATSRRQPAVGRSCWWWPGRWPATRSPNLLTGSHRAAKLSCTPGTCWASSVSFTSIGSRVRKPSACTATCCAARPTASTPGLYWPVIVGALLLLWHFDRRHYAILRNGMLLSGAVGTIRLHRLPRGATVMLPRFTDTIAPGAAEAHAVVHGSIADSVRGPRRASTSAGLCGRSGPGAVRQPVEVGWWPLGALRPGRRRDCQHGGGGGGHGQPLRAGRRVRRRAVLGGGVPGVSRRRSGEVVPSSVVQARPH